jgi:hypothetical protein
LESLERKLDNYEAEMMNNPYDADDLFFNRNKVNRALEHAREAEEVDAGLHVFEKFKPSHRYAIGADVAEGGGDDSSASVVIDFKAGEIVAAFEDNTIAPDRFGKELARQGRKYGKCLIAPERNGSGVAAVIALNDDYSNVFLDHKQAQVGDPVTKKYGWYTSKESKATMMFGLKRAFEDGKLAIYDERILEEMKIYTRQNFTESQRTATKHFDLLDATAIAWQMRDHAQFPDTEDSQFDKNYTANPGL